MISDKMRAEVGKGHH